MCAVAQTRVEVIQKSLSGSIRYVLNALGNCWDTGHTVLNWNTGLRSESLVSVIPVPILLLNLWPKLSLSFSISIPKPEGPVVTVQEQHGERGQLTGPVPAVAAVNHTAGAMHTHFICNLDCPRRSA